MIAGRIYGAGNRAGLPPEWLAETRKLERGERAPDGWLTFADQGEVDAYLDARRGDYEAAVAARPTEPRPATLEEMIEDLEDRVTALEGR